MRIAEVRRLNFQTNIDKHKDPEPGVKQWVQILVCSTELTLKPFYNSYVNTKNRDNNQFCI